MNHSGLREETRYEESPRYEKYPEYTTRPQRKCPPCPPSCPPGPPGPPGPKGEHGPFFTTTTGVFMNRDAQVVNAKEVIQYKFKETENLTESSGAITLPTNSRFLVTFDGVGSGPTAKDTYYVTATLNHAPIYASDIKVTGHGNYYTPAISATFIFDTNVSQNVLRIINNRSDLALTFGSVRLTIVRIA